MGKVRYLSGITAALGVLAALYLATRIAASWMQGYSWHKMDWRQRGTTSIADFLRASDIGKRDVLKAGKKCVEYYSYKDGLTVRMDCS